MGKKKSQKDKHQWQNDDIVMWDNRSAQHAATNDFLPMHRRMERVTVVGDRPF